MSGDTEELNIHGAHLGPHTYAAAIRILERRMLPMDEIVTQRMPLADFQRGIELVASGKTSINVTREPWHRGADTSAPPPSRLCPGARAAAAPTGPRAGHPDEGSAIPSAPKRWSRRGDNTRPTTSPDAAGCSPSVFATRRSPSPVRRYT